MVINVVKPMIMFMIMLRIVFMSMLVFMLVVLMWWIVGYGEIVVIIFLMQQLIGQLFLMYTVSISVRCSWMSRLIPVLWTLLGIFWTASAVAYATLILFTKSVRQIAKSQTCNDYIM